MFPDVRVHTPYPIQFGGDDWITVVTNATGTFTGEMTLPDGKVVPPTGKALDLEFAQTSKWEGDQLIVISAFWDSGYSEAADRPRLAAKYAGRIAGTTVLGSAQLPARAAYNARIPRSWKPERDVPVLLGQRLQARTRPGWQARL